MMEKLKRIGTKLLFPHLAIVILLALVAATLLIYAFAFENANEIVAYLSYGLSAYALVLLCVRTPDIIRRAKNFKNDNKYLSRYLTDTHLRVQVSLYGSLFVNVAYALFQLGLGFWHASVWFYALAGYYGLLAVMRFVLVKETHKSRPGANLFMEHLLYRFCGVLLLLMNLALSVIVTYIVWLNRGVEHHSITTIAMAAYTFGTLAKAIVNVVKYRKYNSPVFSASKAVSLAAASVSVLTLETAMLTAFGQENSDAFRQRMTAATGAAVCLFVLALAVYMIVRSTKQINQIKRGSNYGK